LECFEIKYLADSEKKEKKEKKGKKGKKEKKHTGKVRKK
jgi:hypothetical protein